MKRWKKLARVLLPVLVVVMVVGAILFALLRRQGMLLLPNETRPGRYEVWGVDVSSYQGEVDWSTLRSQGVDFAFIKATEGSGTTDAYFARNWEDAQAAGVLAGAYHFFSYDSPGETQADNFIAQVPVTAGALPPVVDVEFYGDKAQRPPEREAVKEILDPLLERLESRYGQKPILYVTYRTYELYIQGEYENYPLWVTRPMLAPMDKDWNFWQYSHSARLEGYNGKEKHIDLNVFRGSREELEDMRAAEVPAYPDPSVYPDPINGFFRTFEYAGSGTTIATNVMAWREADAWQTEAEHIFDLLRENACPSLAEYGLDLEQMEKDLHTYVENQAELDAYLEYTDILEPWREPSALLIRGTGFPGGQGRAVGEHYRSFVTQMYDIFSFDHGAMTAADCYVFDPQKVLDAFEAEGIPCAMGQYAVGESERDEEPPDNPIDDWTAKWLYLDGVTMAMAEDGYTEMKIWEAELNHAYEVLRERVGWVEGLDEEIRTAQKALLDFAPAYGECVALYQFSSAFCDPEWWEEHPEDPIVSGTLARSEWSRAAARYYRRETLGLWERLGWWPEEPTWVFEPSEYEARLRERYQQTYGKDISEFQQLVEEARP